MNSRKMKVKSEIWWIVGISFIVFILTFFFSPILSYLTGTSQPTCAGGFGDQYGVLNTLFTGLAFVGLIATILLQRKDLELQRKELKRQSDEFETQNKLIETQQFNSFFFHLFNNIVNLKKDINNILIEYEYNPKNKGNSLDLILQIIGDYAFECYKDHEYNIIIIDNTIKKIIPKITPLIKSLYITTDLILKNKHLSEEQIQNYLDVIFGIFTEEESKAVDFFWHYLNYDLIENLEYRKNIIPYSEKGLTEKIISDIKNMPIQMSVQMPI